MHFRDGTATVRRRSARGTPGRQMIHRPLLRLLIRSILSALLLAAVLVGPAIILILTSDRIAM